MRPCALADTSQPTVPVSGRSHIDNNGVDSGPVTLYLLQ